MSWKKEIKEISLRKKLALGQGGKEAIDLQHAKGRLTLRERINLLLDDNSFEEVGKSQVELSIKMMDLLNRSLQLILF